MGETSAVQVSVEGAVGSLRLSDAKRRNPLSVDTMRAVTAGLRSFAGNESVRAVVIEAEGPATICVR